MKSRYEDGKVPKVTLVYNSRVELDRNFASDDLGEEARRIARGGAAVLHVVNSLAFEGSEAVI